MDDDFHLRFGHAEKPAGLDDFKPFIHERRRIDGDFAAHVPCRMFQRLFRRDGGQIDVWTFVERPPRTRENDAVDGIRRMLVNALENGAMFAIDWQQFGTAFLAGLR